MAENENTTSGEEKLNTEEFRQLIPHLEKKQLFMIEIKLSEKWHNLFDAFYEDDVLKGLTCTACSKKLRFDKFEEHIELSTHLDALKKVEDYYHPLFTPKRKYSSLDEETIKKMTGLKTQKANAIVAKMELLKRSSSLKRESSSSVVTLSPEDLMTIEFQNQKEDDWQPMLQIKGKLHASGKYYCEICLRYCVGVIPLQAHLAGAAHRILQLKVHKVRVPKHKNLNKSCRFSLNPEEFTKLSKPKFQFDTKNIKTEGALNKEKTEETKNASLVKEVPRRSPVSKKRSDEVVESVGSNGLIGVEYVAQIEKNSKKGSYMYACGLCNSEIMPSAEMMEKHITSFEHRLSYCERHYLDTVDNFKRMISDCRANYKLVMPFVLEKIALGIDQYHGYGTPNRTSEVHFQKSRKTLCEKFELLPHACQEYGPSFSNAVTSQEIRDFQKNPAEREIIDSNKSLSVRFTVRDPKKYYLHMKHHVPRPVLKHSGKSEKKLDRRSKEPSQQSYTSNDKRSRTRSRSQDHVPRKRRGISNSYGDAEIWSVYRDEISKAAIELERKYVVYRGQPEKHPLYDQEWNTFWRRRKEELLIEGKNHRSYNFQPEWTTYFRQRLEQMFGEDLQKSKVNVRRLLKIPIDAEEDTLPSYPHPIVSVSEHELVKPHILDSWDITSVPIRVKEQFKPLQPQENPNPTVIHMLRLMTALEDHIGTLGSKVLGLLTKAISLEKFYPADSPELEKEILTTQNYKILKTATEKLKSKLYAGLIEGNTANSFKRVIECSEIILKKAETMGWANESELLVDNDNTQIKNLIEVLQNKKPVSPSSKKSLSDALMEVISSKKLKDTIAFDSLMPSLQMGKQSTQISSNIPSNQYFGLQNENMSYFSPIPQNSTVQMNSARGRSNIHFNTQYGRQSFGNTNPQWSNACDQLNFPSYNQGPTASFRKNYPNVSNNGTWGN